VQVLGPVRALRVAQAVARMGGPVLGVDWGRRRFPSSRHRRPGRMDRPAGPGPARPSRHLRYDPWPPFRSGSNCGACWIRGFLSGRSCGAPDTTLLLFFPYFLAISYRFPIALWRSGRKTVKSLPCAQGSTM